MRLARHRVRHVGEASRRAGPRLKSRRDTTRRGAARRSDITLAPLTTSTTFLSSDSGEKC